MKGSGKMEKKKRDVLPILTCVCLVFIAVAFISAFLFESVTGWHYSYHEYIASAVLMGFAIIIVCQFVGEKLFYRLSPVLYVAVIAVLGCQLIVGEHDGMWGMSYLSVFGYTDLFTPNIMFPVYFFIAWYVSRQQKFGTGEYALLTLLMGLPAFLIFLQAQEGPAVLMFAVYVITVCFLKKEKRINVPWTVLIIPAVIVLVAAIGAGLITEYGRSFIDVVLTRGQNSSNLRSEQRLFIDNILRSTPAIGHTELENVSELIEDPDIYWGGYRIVMLLAAFGWIPAVVVVMLTALVHVILFKMVSKIKQSLFARYLSILLSSFLLGQTVLSLLSVAVLGSGFYDLPFFTANAYLTAFNYLSVGIIILLYRRRNEESPLKEGEMKKGESERVSLLVLVRDFLDKDDEDKIVNHYDDFPGFFDAVRKITDTMLGVDGEDPDWENEYEDLSKMAEEDDENECFAELPSDVSEE